MTATELLAVLGERGASVSVEGGRLIVSAPRGALSAELRTALAAAKPGLLAELAARGAAPQSAAEKTKTPLNAPRGGLLAVHDTDDPWATPTAPCCTCGQVAWRVWCHDARKVWQFISNACRPLVVINPDGTRWRA